jgi:hypothetical protein
MEKAEPERTHKKKLGILVFPARHIIRPRRLPVRHIARPEHVSTVLKPPLMLTPEYLFWPELSAVQRRKTKARIRWLCHITRVEMLTIQER